MKCPVFTCKKDKPTIEKLASHIKHMAFNMKESQHIWWLTKNDVKHDIEVIKKKLI